MRGPVNAWKNQAYCIIVDPTNKITIGRNVTTGVSGTVLQFPLGSGPTRIQAIKTNLTERNQTNDTTARPVQFWLDFPKDATIPDVRPGFEMVVTNGGNDPYLVNYSYPVVGAINSSEAWQRTINTVSNLENKPKYNWAFIVGNITNGAGVQVSVQYETAIPGVYANYFSYVTSDATYRVPVFTGVNYKLTFSLAGKTPQTTGAINPTVHMDTAGGNITLI